MDILNMIMVLIMMTVQLTYWRWFGDAQSCVDSVNVQQRGIDRLDNNLYVIVPRSNFSCNGRITGYMASLNQDLRSSCVDPGVVIIVWQPMNPEQTLYSIRDSYTLSNDDINGMGDYYFANVSFTGNDRIEFQSGDVIGYRHIFEEGGLLDLLNINDRPPCYRVWNIRTAGYTSYSVSVTVDEGDIIDIDDRSAVAINTDRQPLIQVTFDIRCNGLSAPANGEIMSCSSGTVGVGYEGDNCSFTCNTGYELTGSDTRTCQSDGNWSGSDDDVCRRVQCPALMNGTLQCPNETTTGVFEDTCTFSCNAGYELQGSNNGTCLANQSWSGGDPICEPLACFDVTMVADSIMTSSSCNLTYQSQCIVSCDEGFIGDDVTYLCNVTSDLTMVNWVPIGGIDVICERVQCPALMNGTLRCPNGATTGLFEDTCIFSCNAGYELQGSDNGTCLANQSWSGGDPICVALVCSTSPPLNNSQLQLSCDTQYQSTCTTVCVDGYTGVGGSYTCVVTDEDTNSVGWNGWTSCERIRCPTLINGVLQCPNETTIGVFEDTCIFSCNAGYELQGSNNVTCLANQSWSRGDPICVALNCSTSPPLNNSQLQSSCDTQYQSTCTTVCVDGYTGVGGSYTCVVTDEDTNSVGWNGSVSCQIDSVRSQDGGDDNNSNIGAVVAGSVVAFIVLLILAICLIILLVWYRNRNKGKRFSEFDSRKQNEDEVLQHHEGTMKNVLYDDVNYYSSADAIVGNHVMTNQVQVAYLNPMKAESTADDYVVYHTLEECEQPQTNKLYYNVSNSFEMADSSISSVDDNYTLPLGEGLSNNEPIYKDPGHRKESIYKWLEQNGLSKVDKRNIRTLQILGSGEFGVVHLALWSNALTGPVQVAVKTLNSQCSESDRVKFLREAAIMGQFVHNNVLQLHGVVTAEENMMIVLEYMPKGDLKNYLKSADKAKSNLQYELLSYCRQIASGMNYLSLKCFIHRDLAARNILLSSENVCKIADFGMARDLTDDTYYVTSGGKIPLKWTAPEAIFYKKYSVQSDVWSFGCVMYEIWSLGHKPFKDLTAKEYTSKIMTGFRLPPPPGCPRAMYELMIQCWHPEARGRPYSRSVLRILENSDEILLQCSVSTNTGNQVTVLGAPLITSEQLYPDLQSQYKTS